MAAPETSHTFISKKDLQRLSGKDRNNSTNQSNELLPRDVTELTSKCLMITSCIEIYSSIMILINY